MAAQDTDQLVSTDSAFLGTLGTDDTSPLWVVDLSQAFALKSDLQAKGEGSLGAAVLADTDIARQFRGALQLLFANQAASGLDPFQAISCLQGIARLLDDTESHDCSFEFQSEAGDRQLSVRRLHTNNADLAPLCVMELQQASAENTQVLAQGQLASIMKAIPDLVWVYDFETEEISYWNQCPFEALGYHVDTSDMTAREITREWSRKIHPEDDMISVEAMARLRDLLSKRSVVEYFPRFKNKAGGWQQYYARIARMGTSTEGRPDQVVVVAHDMTEEIRAQRSLVEQERRYRVLAENVSDVVCTMEFDGSLSFVSPSIESVLGWKPEEFIELYHSGNYRPEVQEYSAEIKRLVAEWAASPDNADTTESKITEITIKAKSGVIIPFEVSLSVLRDEYRNSSCILLLARDISTRLKLDAEQRMAAKVFESSADGILIVDKNYGIVQVNEALQSITGFSESDLIGSKPVGPLFDREQNDWREFVDTAVRDGYWSGDGVAKRANGEEFYAHTTIAALRDRDNELMSYIVTIRDVTESKTHEERIRTLAYYDALTTLPNRTLFADRLEHELQRCERVGHSAALLFLDLDQFKAINDSLGHAAGDQLLKEAALRLKENVRAEDTVARMSGDEFTILLSGQQEHEHVVAAATSVAKKVRERLVEPFQLEGQEVFISVSIGVALFPNDGRDSATLLRNSDTAMYFAKQAGKNTYQFYTPEMNADAIEQLAFQNSLYKAEADREFEVFYQPQYNMDDQCVRRVEALLRWRRPDGQLISPSRFMPMAEQTGLIVSIGKWLIRRSCEQFMEWQSAGIPIDKMSINLSARQFTDDHLLRAIESIVEDTGVSPSAIEFEFTESVLMSDIAHTRSMLQKLKDMGFTIALDDFGTGYSSLTSVRELPIDTIKVDRSLVKNLPGAERDRQIVRVIAALAEGFDLDLVAEGVETPEQAQCLGDMGFNRVQGYLFAGPLPAFSLEQFVLGEEFKALSFRDTA